MSRCDEHVLPGSLKSFRPTKLCPPAVQVVLWPGYAQPNGRTKALKEWDLWGPMVMFY